MFFYLAKGLWFIAQPSCFIAFLALLGAILVWTVYARWGRRIVGLATALLLIAGLSPLGNALILPLEERFARANLDLPPPPTGIIMLGGAEDRIVGYARGVPALNEAAERVYEAVLLAKRFPEAKIAFSGGNTAMFYASDSEAAGAGVLLTGLGIAPDRLILEDKARDTYENASFLKTELERRGLLGPGTRWLLLTSAYHMPRAMGVFREVGLAVEPWPVDYRTRGWADLTRPFDKVSEGLRRVDIATREWVGLVVYRLAGRSNALFPAPTPAAGCDLATPGAVGPPASPCRSGP